MMPKQNRENGSIEELYDKHNSESDHIIEEIFEGLNEHGLHMGIENIKKFQKYIQFIELRTKLANWIWKLVKHFF